MKGRRSAVGLLVLLLLAALAVGLAACGSSSSSGDTRSGGARGMPVKGGTLTVTFQGEPTGLDPAIAWELESNCIERVTYQQLFTYASTTGAAGAQLVGDLATEVPSAANGGITQGGKVYTFHVKKGVKFAPTVPLYQEVWTDMYDKNTGGFYIQPVWTFVFQEYWKTNGK